MDQTSGAAVGRRLAQRWPYYFLCRRLADQTSGPEVGRRLEQRWPYYFLVEEVRETRSHRLWPALRAEVALLFQIVFLVQVEQRWPYHFL